MYRSSLLSIRFAVPGLSLLLLSACGLPGPGSSTNPQDGGENGGQTKFEDVVNIRVETNEEMRTSLQSDLFNLITPQKAWALRGLEENNSLPDTAISVITLDSDFRDRGRIADPFVVDKNNSGAGYDILFQKTVEKQLNRVVRVTLPNNDVIYGPLYKTVQGDNTVIVSVASHYVIKKLYDAIQSRTQLEELLSCEERNTNCAHQSRVKLEHIVNLIELVHNYDLLITPEMNVQEVMALFDETQTLRNMVETGIQEILRDTSPIARGTARNFSPLDSYEPKQLTRPLTYNSSWFALELGTFLPNSPVKRVSIGASTSRIIPIGTLTPNNSLPIYPILTHTAQFFQVRTDGLTLDIPFTRSTMTYTRNNIFTVSNNDIFQAHSAASIDTFLSTEGNIMAGTVLEQTIDSENIGWQSNPVYKQFYRVNQYEPNLDPDSTAENTPSYPDTAPWLVSANVMKAENYRIVDAGNDRVRNELLEDRYLFSWEVHAEEADIGFSTQKLSNKSYGVLRYGVRLTNSNPVVELTAETLLWQAQPEDLIQSSQPEPHYRSYQLSRNTLHEVTGPTQLPASSALHAYTTVLTIEDDNNPQTPNTTISNNKGLIKLEGGTRPTSGHVSNNGSHFSLVLNRPATGVAHRAFIVGSQLYSGPGLFNEVRYTLQGNTMGLSAEKTQLTSLNQSTLMLSNNGGGCHAELTLRRLTVSQEISENVLNPPVRLTDDPIQSTDCSIVGSTITVEFGRNQDDPDSVPTLTLTGFFSKSEQNSDTSNLINLLWLQEDNMGLVFATRDQQLPHNFDPDQPNND